VNNCFTDFKFAMSSFEMVLQAKDKAYLPAYQGSTLRGAFGRAFRTVTCAVRRTDCSDCLLKDKCVYAYVFETPRPEGAEMMRLYPTVPHPFILEPPTDGPQEISPGQALKMGLTAVGRGLEFLPYYVYAVRQMGRQGLGRRLARFELDSVTQTGWLNRSSKPVFRAGEEKLERPNPPVVWEDIVSLAETPEKIERIGLEFQTPLRIKFGGRFVADLEFHHLVRNLLRRLSALAYFHCGWSGQLDFRSLIKKSETVRTLESGLQWRDWERYSSRQQERMKMGGLVGSISFTGGLTEFLPLLYLGELVHVGKGTSFGLGKYQIMEIG